MGLRSYSYDLHVHSCLSPCGDDDMTPATIAGMAKLNGLDICALTDHNSSKNCKVFAEACRYYGVIPLCGMELTTSEDVHMICLFSKPETALEFDSYVDAKKVNYKNRPEIFGNQFIVDTDDNIIGEEKNLLINATTVSIDEAFEKVYSLGGACYPAHIDREANGIVAVLGTFPQTPHFTSYELNDAANLEKVINDFPWISSLNYLVCSDAHRITDISCGENKVMLDDNYPDASEAVINLLRGDVSFGR